MVKQLSGIAGFTLLIAMISVHTYAQQTSLNTAMPSQFSSPTSPMPPVTPPPGLKPNRPMIEKLQQAAKQHPPTTTTAPGQQPTTSTVQVIQAPPTTGTVQVVPPPPTTSNVQVIQAPPTTDTPQGTKQFEQWLQSNGQNVQYQQPPTQPGAGMTPPPSGNQSDIVATFAAPPAGASPETVPPGTTTAIAPTNTTQPPNLVVPPPKKQNNYRRGRPLTYEEGQEVMLKQAPAADLSSSDEAALAFDALLRQNTPLSPQQIVKLRQHIDRSQRAAAVQPNIPPKPVSSTLMINLAPGATPPAVRLAQGYVSSLVFVDSTGAPWPIAAFDIGNPTAVNIQWDGKSNILLLQAVLPYSNGDIVIRLVGLPTPITLELVAGQRVVDFRVDIHVSGLGPNAKDVPIGTALPGSANQLLLGVLDGIGPAGSRPLSVHGADAQAWLLGSRIYLRTRLTVLSPGWIGTMVSPDGMRAYELPRTSSVLVSRYGEPVALKIGGF